MLEELHIYGSQRLGVIKENRLLAKYINIFPPSSPLKINTPNTPYIPAIPKSIGGSITPITPIPLPYNFVYYYFGKKHYELADWLGNVRVVINDKKTPQGTNASDMTYAAQVLEVNDYYPFGMEIRERSYENVKYRFGFNKGSEKDREITSQKDRYFTTFYREGDTYTATWWSVDPKFKEQPWQSPYVMMDNNPLRYNDPQGGQVDVIVDLAFIGYDVYDIAKTWWKGEKTTSTQWTALRLDALGALVPGVTGLGKGYRALSATKKTIAHSSKGIVIHTADKVVELSTEELTKLGIKEVKHHAGPGTFKKVAVIGRNMEKRVKPFAKELEKKGIKVEIFEPSPGAKAEWKEWERIYKKRIPEGKVYESKGFKENVRWREKLRDEGYDILDIGGSTKDSPFYKMEKDPVWEKKSSTNK